MFSDQGVLSCGDCQRVVCGRSGGRSDGGALQSPHLPSNTKNSQGKHTPPGQAKDQLYIPAAWPTHIRFFSQISPIAKYHPSPRLSFNPGRRFYMVRQLWPKRRRRASSVQDLAQSSRWRRCWAFPVSYTSRRSAAHLTSRNGSGNVWGFPQQLPFQHDKRGAHCNHEKSPLSKVWVDLFYIFIEGKICAITAEYIHLSANNKG